jgi:hypothetical protein
MIFIGNEDKKMIQPLTADDVNCPPPYEVKWKEVDWNHVRQLEAAAKAGDNKALEELDNILNAALIKVDPVTGEVVD